MKRPEVQLIFSRGGGGYFKLEKNGGKIFSKCDAIFLLRLPTEQSFPHFSIQF